MSLAICSDLSPASWIVTSDVPWDRLVTFGPGGFAAYARVRFIPDPTHHGQRETEADVDGSPSEVAQWRALLQLLATETSDPSDCYFGLWEGWPFPESARQWPTFGVPRGARIAARSFFLFRGALSEAEIWGEPAHAGIWGRPEFSHGGTPAFVWPSDHTWCVAADVDPHWAGVERPCLRSNGSSLIGASTQSPLTLTANSRPTGSGRVVGVAACNGSKLGLSAELGFRLHEDGGTGAIRLRANARCPCGTTSRSSVLGNSYARSGQGMQ